MLQIALLLLNDSPIVLLKWWWKHVRQNRRLCLRTGFVSTMPTTVSRMRHALIRPLLEEIRPPGAHCRCRHAFHDLNGGRRASMNACSTRKSVKESTKGRPPHNNHRHPPVRLIPAQRP